MRRYTEATTPCPAPNPSFQNIDRYYQNAHRPSTYANSTASYLQDDTTTTTLEYTTEIQTRIRNTKPRRRLKESGRNSTFNPAMDIFEDVALEEQAQLAEVGKRSRASVLPQDGGARRSTILAHPAQKLPIVAPAIQGPLTRPTRRRVSSILADRQVAEPHIQDDCKEKRKRKEPEIRKDPRRRTIYVPSDDTTIMTIHPGAPTHRYRGGRAKSPDFGLDLVTLSEEEPDNLIPALRQDKKGTRKSLAVPPKRGPLQHTSRPVQSVSFAEDIIGRGGGKENIPPGTSLIEDAKSTKRDIQFHFGTDDSKTHAKKSSKVHFTASKAFETVETSRVKGVHGSRKRPSSELSFSGSPLKSLKAKADTTANSTRARKAAVRRVSKEPPTQSSSPFQPANSPPNALRRHRIERPPTKLSVPIVAQKPEPQLEKYPVLSEDLARPELYEDHWLSYQEVAITQLLNVLFDSINKDFNHDQNPENLRKSLISLYHEPAIPILHKRLQASLMYGALSIPKDILAHSLRLKDDIGLRRKFLNLWVDTYDLTLLKAAAETVVGRQIPVSSRLSGGSTNSDGGERQTRAEKRAIEGFLDTFLIRNEDAVRIKAGIGSIASIARGSEHHGDDFGSQGWSWRRTVLRSLMLVLLLDKAKNKDLIPGCLFQIPSSHKNSAAVLHSLAAILLPSLGDITRPLGHLNYRVEHVQYRLQEYTYHISNLATDLRNGVLLTRLVELLLYPPSTLASHNDEAVTITMPTGEFLTSTFDLNQKETWVLSQHLKFPSDGRAQKLYNVQIALSALEGVKGIPSRAILDINAEDIVDGHREKTLGLLWALVGKWGLSTLVNWTEVGKEIARFREMWYEQQSAENSDLCSDEDDAAGLEGLELHTHLLLSWSRSIARLCGVRVSNLTTSFADGKVLEMIVDAYLPYCPTIPSASSTSSKPSLAAKLRATGCSASFISLFTPGSAPSIPSRDFTLLTLSFLASRLLPASLAHRAAMTIQRAYRLRLLRRRASRRVILMRLAKDCATVARTREQVVGAATVLQRAWRELLQRRSERLTRNITAFQAMARGWAVRRLMRGINGGKLGGKGRERRIRGGW
ncbi:hypothetical protein K432DRAFT_383725 [Lepidopterella palustris CBS 459.81]|uniref:Calponin-homology (CH) domain-containing protein n=1 Tax=Lepidopterella palustris CBS 459.81 TaxID=1314670 RepID=A0A8E2E7I6_9PEZI|nr:hypothetical protein K432DRAFT_383725 [Lepidopterella palustris CBS 459.81]